MIFDASGATKTIAAAIQRLTEKDGVVGQEDLPALAEAIQTDIGRFEQDSFVVDTIRSRLLQAFNQPGFADPAIVPAVVTELGSSLQRYGIPAQVDALFDTAKADILKKPLRELVSVPEGTTLFRGFEGAYTDADIVQMFRQPFDSLAAAGVRGKLDQIESARQKSAALLENTEEFERAVDRHGAIKSAPNSVWCSTTFAPAVSAGFAQEATSELRAFVVLFHAPPDAIDMEAAQYFTRARGYSTDESEVLVPGAIMPSTIGEIIEVGPRSSTESFQVLNRWARDEQGHVQKTQPSNEIWPSPALVEQGAKNLFKSPL